MPFYCKLQADDKRELLCRGQLLTIKVGEKEVEVHWSRHA